MRYRALAHITSVLLLAVTACGSHPATTTLPKSDSSTTPAQDLAAAKHGVTPVPAGDKLVVKDPRVTDLDIIRIKVTPRGVGGDPEITTVATADLFRQAGEAAKDGRTQAAMNLYRQIVTEFPDSQYAPISLFNIAAIYDGRADLAMTIDTLRELVKAYPDAHESVEGHLYIAALQADHKQWAEAAATLDAALARPNLSYADRVEGFARKGYAELELSHYDVADIALAQAVTEWQRAPRIEDPYYIAMATYYRGELVHRKFEALPIRLPDDQLVKDVEAKRVLAVQAYDRWKESLHHQQAYWATASGYQMSQIFVELWEATVKAPYPTKVAVAARPTYVTEVHEKSREHLEKALEGHRMNVELAKAYGVDTSWSKGSEQQAVKIMETLAKDAAGNFVTPP